MVHIHMLIIADARNFFRYYLHNSDVLVDDTEKLGERELKIVNPSNKSISGSFLWWSSRHVPLPHP
jgi:hypothetical protein